MLPGTQMVFSIHIVKKLINIILELKEGITLDVYSLLDGTVIIIFTVTKV